MIELTNWWHQFDEYASASGIAMSRRNLEIALTAERIGLSPRAAVAALRNLKCE